MISDGEACVKEMALRQLRCAAFLQDCEDRFMIGMSWINRRLVGRIKVQFCSRGGEELLTRKSKGHFGRQPSTTNGRSAADAATNNDNRKELKELKVP